MTHGQFLTHASSFCFRHVFKHPPISEHGNGRLVKTWVPSHAQDLRKTRSVPSPGVEPGCKGRLVSSISEASWNWSASSGSHSSKFISPILPDSTASSWSLPALARVPAGPPRLPAYPPGCLAAWTPGCLAAWLALWLADGPLEITVAELVERRGLRGG
jgi:hypothetical protein